MYDCSFGLEVNGGSNWATDYTTISYRMLVLKGGTNFNPEIPERPKLTNFLWYFVSNETFDLFKWR